ncbi:MAG: hypothetical protein KAH32_06900 [Chlamydiia bacterium]|nr:hypothetical protein [Chlamydiia bacterium]
MDKKYINKAGFKSFFKNKTGAILLAIIVFLSATTFTVLQSSVSNYTKSYDHIMAEGKLHDYTMKESYKATGDVKYEVVKKDPNKADESKYVGSDTPYTNSQYMVMSVGYFRNGGILSSFNEEIVKKATTTE